MLVRRLRSAFICLLSCVTAGALAQTTLNVGPGQPYATIQSAIGAAHNGDTVLVAPGTYNENISFNGKAITVTSSGGPAVTTIDGGSRGGVPTVLFNTGEGKDSVLSNLTIRGGGESLFLSPEDGGVWINSASPTIRNNRITGNYCHNIHSEAGSPQITANEISAVLQDVQGLQGASYCLYRSGLFIDGTAGDGVPGPVVSGNTIENNLLGPGIKLTSQDVLISNNIIRNNVSVDTGSAISSQSSGGVVLFQNLIYGNASDCGGALALEDYSYRPGIPGILVVNNTIVDNVTPRLTSVSNCAFISQIYPDPSRYGENDPGTIFLNNVISGSTPYPAVNCSWYKTPSESIQPTFQNNILYNADGAFFGSHCIDVSSRYNNIVADPQFVDSSHGDYHLKSTSPAIDMGQNSVLETLAALTGFTLTTDFDGNPRIQAATGHNCTIDIGAYEYPGNNPACGGLTETLTSSLNPSTFGQTVTFTAQLASQNGTPTGSVQFSDGSTVLGTQTVSATGASTFTTGQLGVGSHTITAAYQPTGNFSAATATLTQVVNGYSTGTQLTSSINPATVGQLVTFTAAVSSPNGTPAGTVTFTDASSTLATVALTSGAAAFTTSALASGSHQVTATFAPSGAFAGSSETLTETINGRPTSTTLHATPNPSTAFSTLTLSAAVSAASGTPTGTVTFTSNGVALGSAPLNASGQATLSVAAPLPGTYTSIATYTGDPSFAASASAPFSETVLPAASTTALSASPNPAYQGQAVAFTAIVSGLPAQLPSGSVIFYEGPTTLGSASLSATASATLTLSNLAPGTHTVTASYAGTGAYAASVSSPVQEVILPGTFNITLTPSAFTIHAGQPGTTTVALTSIGGFSGPLQLSVGTLPAYANATLSPASITLAAGGSGSATLLLNASTSQLTLPSTPALGRSAPILAACTMLLTPFGLRRRGKFRTGLGILLLGALLTGTVACGTVGFPFHTAAPGTYTLPVTAVDTNQNSRTALLTLTVTP